MAGRERVGRSCYCKRAKDVGTLVWALENSVAAGKGERMKRASPATVAAAAEGVAWPALPRRDETRTWLQIGRAHV